MVKTLSRIAIAISLAIIAWAHLYDTLCKIVQHQYLEEERRKGDIPVRP